MRADRLALALAQAKEAGDRFSLVLAGRPGGVAVGPEQFRHGPLSVALERLFSGDGSGPGETLNLAGAVAAAFQQVCPREAGEAPLGAGAVLLVAARPLGAAADALADLAHQGAMAGVPLSVVGVGAGFVPAELDRLALAGQGSRRVLASRADASRLVEAELAASSGVVARAVRLRIRLAAGVRLVEVVAARRLDDAQAERVRAVERSIDLRLAESLGLEADRGEDEDGIQIVIPAFQAGDAHVVLLDVVAPGPGPLAELGVRYKDVLFGRNAVARAGVSLARGERPAGPLERNVLKNLLVQRLAQSLAEAALALEEREGADAASLALAAIEEARALRSGLLARVPGLAADAELARDVALLGEYARLLASGSARAPELARIAASLRCARQIKRLPRPVSAGGARG